jgi:DNA mismatch endonuclease (patch repair protein)
MDKISTEKRSFTMKQIHSKNTKPEMVVRKLIFRNGFRYRLHRKELPGTPDIVFSKIKKVIFVNGCFWHGHGCHRSTLPKTNIDYWKTKIEKNIERDKKQLMELSELGWRYYIVWECEMHEMDILEKRVISFLEL